VATDASEQSREAEEKALVWADAFEASIHGLYVVEQGLSDSDEVKEELETEGKQAVGELEARAKDAGVEASTAVDIGVPHEVICSQAEENDTDLIALGAHGRSGIERTYFGSVAQRTVRTATRPVLVV
jgi:nucleotide-binding universal stress UspA family protein